MRDKNTLWAWAVIFVTSAHARPDVRNFLTSGNGCVQSPSFPYLVTKKRRTLGTRMLESCLLWQLKLTEFCVNLWCFQLSFSTGCTKWNSAAIRSLLLFMASLFGFWLRNTSLVKVGHPISDGIVFVFHLASCVRGLQLSLKRYTFQGCISNGKLSNYCIWCLFFISNLMKSSVVYAAILFTHVCKIWDMIWPSIRFI